MCRGNNWRVPVCRADCLYQRCQHLSLSLTLEPRISWTRSAGLALRQHRCKEQVSRIGSARQAAARGLQRHEQGVFAVQDLWS